MVLNTQCYQYICLTMWFHTKKSNETLKKHLLYITSAPELRNDQTTWLYFLYRYGIFWMVPGESSCPGGSEYEWQRGIQAVLGRVTAGRNLPYFQKRNCQHCCVQNKSHSQNLRNWACPRKSLLPIYYGKKRFEWWGSIPKILGVGFTGWFF